MLQRALPLALAALLACSACDDAPASEEQETAVVSSMEVRMNPSGYAPLTAEITLTTRVPVAVTLTVEGRHGPDTDVSLSISRPARTFSLPVLGLYAGSSNPVRLSFTAPDGTDLGSTTISLDTPPILSDLPQIRIDTRDASASQPGFTLVSYFGHNGSPTPQRPFIFDPAGDIRWYLDLRNHPQLGNAFFDDGLERLQNGNLYGGDNTSSRIYEISMLGEVVNTWAMPGYSFHHQVLEKPDGNFLVTVNRHGAATVEDHVIEIDRASGTIVNVWDLRQALDSRRRTWETDLANLDVDWFHANALAYDPSDNTIIVSGRTQGVVKLTQDNAVVWILAPHRGWATAGDGTDLSKKLLQPLDAQGLPISDAAVLAGDANHPDFEWAWYQHATKVLPDGGLLLFDNGDNRNYAHGVNGRYSRAVIYQIDATARTIRQAWTYGKARGEATYSRIVSDVDFHPATGTVVFMPGAVQPGSAPYGKIVEVQRASGRVVFEATVTAPSPHFGITFHRAERLPLYPPAFSESHVSPRR